MWLAVVLTLGVVGWLAPGELSVVALMAACALFLTATRARLSRTERSVEARPAPPYRSYEPLHRPSVIVVHELSSIARPRLFVGSLVALYVAGSCAGFTGGALPEHDLWLDAALGAACFVASRRWRRPMLLVPLAPVVLHLSAERGWISGPTTWLE